MDGVGVLARPLFQETHEILDEITMAFTAKDVQKLREMTGCRHHGLQKGAHRSLTAISTSAVEWLREKGLAAADQKGWARVAAEGVVLRCGTAWHNERRRRHRGQRSRPTLSPRTTVFQDLCQSSLQTPSWPARIPPTSRR